MKTSTFLFLSIFFVSPLIAGNLVSSFSLQFKTDSFQLNTEHIKQLNAELANLNQDKSRYFIEIDGHTDTDGGKYYNEILSLKRAKSTREFLLSCHFTEKHIFTKAHAFYKPKSSNNNEDGKQKNRRVEVRVFTPHKHLSSLGSHQLKKEQITINASEDQEIVFESGIRAKIPAYAFVDELGEPVEGEITLAHKNYKDYKDFVLSEIPMSFINGTDEYFSSAGMFELRATQKDREVSLAEGKSIDIEMPATSKETNTELFIFNEEQDTWETMEQPLDSRLALETYVDTIQMPIQKRKLECVGYGFYMVDKMDTAFLDSAIQYLSSNSLYDQKLLDLAKTEIELKRINHQLSKWEFKYKKLNSFPHLKGREDKDGSVLVEILTEKRNQLSSSELKYLRTFKLKTDASTWKQMSAIDEISDMELTNISKRNLKIRLTAMNGSQYDFELDPEANGSRKRFRRYMHSLEEYFSKAKGKRQTRLELAKQKSVEFKFAQEAMQVHRDGLQADLNNAQIMHQSFLKQLLLTLERYNIQYNRSSYRMLVSDQLSFARKELDELELEKWLVSQPSETEIIKQAKNIRQGIYCSDFNNANEIIGFTDKIRSRTLTKSGKAASDILFTFSMQEMGVYNVDRLLKQENTLLVEADKYVDENNEKLFISNLYLVGERINGVINYSGLYGYTPYNFLVEDHFSYSLLAVDLDGNTYKMSSHKFKDAMSMGNKNCVLKLKKIEDTEDVELLTMN